MVSHRLVARVVVGTDVNTKASCLSAHTAVGSSTVVPGVSCDGVDGVVCVSAHIGKWVVRDELMIDGDDAGVGCELVVSECSGWVVKYIASVMTYAIEDELKLMYILLEADGCFPGRYHSFPTSGAGL